MKNSAKSMREIAERRVSQFIRDNIDPQKGHNAKAIIDLVIETLQKPDKAMLDAGRAELRLAVHQQIRTIDVTNLAVATWHAMLGRTH